MTKYPSKALRLLCAVVLALSIAMPSTVAFAAPPEQEPTVEATDTGTGTGGETTEVPEPVATEDEAAGGDTSEPAVTGEEQASEAIEDSEPANEAEDAAVLAEPLSTLDEATGSVTPLATTALEGAGTELSPYLIQSPADLLFLAQRVNAGTDTYYEKFLALTADINLASDDSTKRWTPIGSASAIFRGTFDGRGHTISGLYVDGASLTTSAMYLGLFGYITTATLKNFVVQGRIISLAGSTYMIGGAVGYAASLQLPTNPITFMGSTISNVGSEVDIVASLEGASSGSYSVGGVVGYSFGRSNTPGLNTISSCYYKGSIEKVGGDTGGIVGEALNTSITGCHSNGSIEIAVPWENVFLSIGGIIGDRGSGYPFDACYSTISFSFLNEQGYTYHDVGGVSGTAVTGSPAATRVFYLNSWSTDLDLAVPKADDVLQSAAFLEDLDLNGDYFKEGNRYPVLNWEAVTYGAPVINEQPVASSYAVQSATPTPLSVEAAKPTTDKAAKDGALSWQWYSNTEPSTEDGTPAEGATATTENFVPPTADPGFTWYYCVITNTWGASADGPAGSAIATSAPSYFGVVTGTADAKPVITSEPEDQTVIQFEAIEDLTVEATVGAGELSYQWYASATESFDDAEAIKYETEATYTPSSSVMGTTYYFCAISNGLEVVKTRAIKVRITGIPISTPSDLLAVAEAVNGGTTTYAGATFELMNDIDLSSDPETASWTPIGTSLSYNFRGSLYGSGHTISGLSIDVAPTATSYLGLFGYIRGATLRDFVVKGSIAVQATTGTYLGGVAGYVNYSSVASPNVGSTILNVGSEVRISANQGANSYVGGVAGYIIGSTAAYNTISSCYYKGALTDTAYYVGGIAAYASYTNFSNCYNTGTLTLQLNPAITTALYVGGIVASRASGGTVDACFNAGKIEILGAGTTNRSIGGVVATNTIQGITQTFYSEDSWTSDFNESTGRRSSEYLQTPAFLEDIDPDGLSYKEGALYPVLQWEPGTSGSPILITQPVSNWVELGSRPSALSVEAALPGGTKAPASGTLFYQWYRSTTADNEGGVRISGAANSSYTPSTATAGTTWYYCVVTNRWTGEGGGSTGTASAPAKFFVLSATPAGAPVITAHPQDAQFATGSTAAALQITAEAPAIGGGALSYQWYALTGESPDLKEDTLLRRETGTSYMPPTALPLGTYGYYCVVTNTFEDVKHTPKISYVANVSLVPLYIDNAAELLAFSQSVNAGNRYIDCTIELTADIDLSEVCGATFGEGSSPVNWLPIGNSSNAFAGTFDGRGHTISNLYYNNTATSGNLYQGLFGYTSGFYGGNPVLKNFVVDGTLSTKARYTGAVVGYVSNGTLLQNVGNKVDVTVVGTSSSNAAGVGGLVGNAAGTETNHLTVRNCYNQGIISTDTADYVGGLIGVGSNVHIEGSYNTGKVSVSRAMQNGGLVGTSGNGYISDSYVTGALEVTTSMNSNADGAIVGSAGNTTYEGRFVNNYYLSSVYSTPNGSWNNSPVDTTNNHSVVTVEEMQTQDFVDSLNRTGTEDPTTYYRFVENSYPKLYWEDATVLDEGSFTISGIVGSGYTYTGGPITLEGITVKEGQITLTEGKDYTFSYANNTSAGPATLIVTGIGSYRGELSVPFTIKQAPLTITVRSLEKAVGAPDPVFTATAPGLKGSDALGDLKVTRVEGESRGSYAVTDAVALIEGKGRNATGNYDITLNYAQATLTIGAINLATAGFTISGLNPEGYIYAGSALTPAVTVAKGSTTLILDTDYTVSYSSNTAKGQATVTVTGKGNYTGQLSATFAINAPEKTDWPRLDGGKENGNRFDTMQAIVGEGWSSSNYVIVASGMNFPDALAASSLAGIYGAPVILTEPGGLTSQAQETIQSLGATKAFIIGGEAAVSPQTFAALEGVVGQGNVSRISGEGRIETALDIYEKGKTPEGGLSSWGDTAIIANGFNFADALSISPYAHVTRSPIFLSTPDTYPGSGLDEATLAALISGGFKKIVITGGTAAVPALVEDQLAQTGVSIERWSGETRYETSVDIVENSLANSNGALSLNNLVCATGDNYPDALAGGAFAGHTGTVLLLVHGTQTGGLAGLDLISEHKDEIGKGHVLGGAAAVPDALLDLLQKGSRD